MLPPAACSKRSANNMKLRFALFSLFALLIIAMPFTASAALIDSSLIAEASCTSGCTINTFVKLGVSVANFILGIVGALTLLMFVYGGLTWILSAGSSSAVQKGKDIIIGSVVGLLIVFCSYLIINFVVNNVLGAKDANNKALFNGSVDNTQPVVTPGTQCKAAGNSCISQNECATKGGSSIGKSDCGGDTVCCTPPKN